MKKIFICYRSADEPHAAALIDQILIPHFGADAVFRASRSIDVGDDFEETIFRVVRTASVLIVVIGPHWLDAQGENGRRLDDPDDMVRREILTAFEHDVRVVPVLLGAPRLKPADLPKKLRRLAKCQDVRVNFRNIEYDLPALVERLRRVMDTDGPAVAEPVTRSVLVVDVENSRTAKTPDTVTRRHVVREIVREAFVGTRIALGEVVIENHGDRVVAVLDAEPLNVLGSVVDDLVTALRRHNLTVAAQDWLRLRIAVHNGLVRHDEHGWSGADLTEACDLLDVPQVRTVLERADRAQCAVVVPDSVYRRFIVHGHDELDVHAYAPLAGSTGWIRVPGYPVPPVDDTPPAAASESARPTSPPLPNHVANMFLQNDIEHLDASVRYGTAE